MTPSREAFCIGAGLRVCLFFYAIVHHDVNHDCCIWLRIVLFSPSEVGSTPTAGIASKTPETA